MKEHVISTMLADPECDPTSWLGKALIAWIKEHPADLVADPGCRKYLISAMDHNDVSVISRGLATYYKESKDIDIIKKLIGQVNNLGDNSYYRSASDYTWVAFEQIFRRAEVDPTSQTELAKSLCELKDCRQEPSKQFIDCLEQDDALNLINNWDSESWESDVWNPIIDKFEGDEIKYFANLTFLKKLDRNRDRWWPRELQRILYHILIRLPKTMVKEWVGLLEEAEFTRAWGYEETKDLGRWVWKGEGPVKINDKLCPCGFIAKSSQGFKLHQNKCYSTDYGKTGKIVYTASAIRLAVVDPSSMICSSCGKKMKSQSGLTLHMKKCEPDPRYDEVRTLDLVKNV